MKPGDVVTTYYRTNPDGRPYRGVVLAVNDPRAWEDTGAFPGRRPTQEEVDAHIERMRQTGIDFSDEVPVEWEFGKVYWEPVHKLVPYEEGVKAWQGGE